MVEKLFFPVIWEIYSLNKNYPASNCSLDGSRIRYSQCFALRTTVFIWSGSGLSESSWSFKFKIRIWIWSNALLDLTNVKLVTGLLLHLNNVLLVFKKKEGLVPYLILIRTQAKVPSFLIWIWNAAFFPKSCDLFILVWKYTVHTEGTLHN